jgi:DNA-binding FrmR family transcriptional regulator
LETKIISRLHRIEGQARGIENMIRDNKGTPQLIQQLEAMRQATNQIISLLIEDKFCDPERELTPENVEFLRRFIKRI